MPKDKFPDKSLPPVDSINERQIRRTHAEIADISGHMPELDLHGQFGQEASIAVYNYVSLMANSGESCCRIIHGKGTGVLERVVKKELDDLQQQNIIETYFQSQKYPGAAVVVIF
jgi:DNA-nicking Smr family endonuclease